MLTTPFGTPASTSSSPSFSTEKQESSEGLSTTLHPAASAGAIFQADCVRGPFQVVDQRGDLIARARQEWNRLPNA